ncbi:cytochrome P450 [Fomitopsis serialis]|uniref:cytochrome P450 n=1 Tax=Fomitopsis serialis TaxID=139415 RepID=UPI002008CA19|nr:cytochrome P450 [Neoantrodia serialis]KAH9917073.1 cytochrome P450 [Neoantrodia serialis]
MTISLGVQAAFAAVILVTLAYYVPQWRQLSRRRHLPPGPRPFPVLGNILQMALEFPEKRFAQWGKKYGDMIFLRMFNTPVLVINSAAAARDLLDKRSAIYSDRPHSVMMTDLLGWEHDFSLMSYNEEFRKHRRWMQKPFFSRSCLAAFADMQRRDVIALLVGLLNDPEDFGTHIYRYFASFMLQYLYGHTLTSPDDEYYHVVEKAVEETMNFSTPGTLPVDLIPSLRYLPAWFPGAGFKQNAVWIKKTVRDAAQRTYDLAESMLTEDGIEASVISSLIKESSSKGTLDSEKPEIMMFGLALYADTTQTVLMVFLLAMVLYPDVYAKAQEEIDRVIGGARLPTFTDRDALPYLDCILKETYRYVLLFWASPTCCHRTHPTGVSHVLREDDEYRGCWIPKGTMVMPNLWSTFMLHDANVYPDPETFCPDRFNGLYESQEDPRNIVFGFGRRICPGRRFAEIGIWQAMANIVATFDLGKARDAMDNEITPPGTFSSGFINHPHKFKCTMTPRSKKAIELITNGKSTQT